FIHLKKISLHMKFTLCHHNPISHVVGYTREDKCDCAFVYRPSVVYKTPPKTLTPDELLQLWRAAAESFQVPRFQYRSIHFFPRVQDFKEAEKFIKEGIKQQYWDHLIYWPSPDAAGTPELFPKDAQDSIAIKQILLNLYAGAEKWPLKNLQGL